MVVVIAAASLHPGEHMYPLAEKAASSEQTQTNRSVVITYIDHSENSHLPTVWRGLVVGPVPWYHNSNMVPIFPQQTHDRYRGHGKVYHKVSTVESHNNGRRRNVMYAIYRQNNCSSLVVRRALTNKIILYICLYLPQ